ncbi:translation elongation factor Ts [Prosthecobacter dejongeii]|uniref:Elongation factor Ts n=1 Tax=Prosthecobacter dejongeii TaxID=48465 RepID=A0A7W7YM49_9BACT|nr:translation elongation factor Ts [Prosthecobacter dejongeii]MBB5038710.1 elongation factor Ts [Prosthecobacter dejongeii]
MAEISAKVVMALREKTNAAMMECKAALKEADGDLEKAEVILRKKGTIKAEKKADRQTKEGIIASYIHMAGRIGVLIEVNCETDFVARNEIFQAFVKDISLHIAAANPKFLGREEIPADLIAKERDIAADQIKGKPAEIAEKIIQGKIDKIFSDQCLLEQPFIKNPDQTIGDFVKSKISELGENLVVRRFVRFAVGEDLATA